MKNTQVEIRRRLLYHLPMLARSPVPTLTATRPAHTATATTPTPQTTPEMLHPLPRGLELPSQLLKLCHFCIKKLRCVYIFSQNLAGTEPLMARNHPALQTLFLPIPLLYPFSVRGASCAPGSLQLNLRSHQFCSCPCTILTLELRLQLQLQPQASYTCSRLSSFVTIHFPSPIADSATRRISRDTVRLPFEVY